MHNDKLDAIEKTINQRRDAELWTIGCKLKEHVSECIYTYDPVETAKAVMADCKLMMKLVEHYETHLQKLSSARRTIARLENVYLD